MTKSDLWYLLEKKNQIDISNLLSGIYFILIKSGDKYLYSKFIKN